MAKLLHVTVDNWVYDEIVDQEKPTDYNKSEWVSKLLIKGYEAEKRQRALKDEVGGISTSERAVVLAPIVAVS